MFLKFDTQSPRGVEPVLKRIVGELAGVAP